MFQWLKRNRNIAPPAPPVSDREQRQNEIDGAILADMIGAVVIAVSNEPENITVGVGLEIAYITQAQVPKLVVRNIITGEDVMPMGKLFRFTWQKFDALNSMSANGRIAVIYDPLGDAPVKKIAQSMLYAPATWHAMVEEKINELGLIVGVEKSA